MSSEGLALARERMQAAGVAGAAIEVFSHYYRQVESGATGLIREDTIEPLLPVHDGLSLLDLAVAQVRAAREKYSVRLPLLLMNSFRTHEDCLAALEVYPDLAVPGVPLDFLQNSQLKLWADD